MARTQPILRSVLNRLLRIQRRTVTIERGRQALKVGSSLLRSSAGFVSWCMLAGVAVVLWVRSSEVSNPLTIAIACATSFAAVPLGAAIVGSMISRGRLLRLGAGLTASVFFFATTPLDAVIGCGPATAGQAHQPHAESDELTILTANVLIGAEGAEEVAEMIVESEADLVSLQEVTEPMFTALKTDPSLAEYVYKEPGVAPRPTFTVTMSKVPGTLRATEPADRWDGVVVPAAESNPIEHGFTFTALHLSAPVTVSNINRWHRQLDLMAELPTDQPAILAGDFNASKNHQPFRELLDAGWTDVHEEKGCGFDTTFPSKNRFPVSMIRIDHILVTDHFEVVQVDVLDPANKSDHNAVLAKVRWAEQKR